MPLQTTWKEDKQDVAGRYSYADASVLVSTFFDADSPGAGPSSSLARFLLASGASDG